MLQTDEYAVKYIFNTFFMGVSLSGKTGQKHSWKIQLKYTSFSVSCSKNVPWQRIWQLNER
jgi:hypothetical protein